MQKHFSFVLFALWLGLLMSACSSAPSNTSSSASSGLDTSYANALNSRSMLLLGTVRLEEGTSNNLTKDQATKLLPLWQASKSLTGSGTASQAEIDAITNQISAVMTADQIKAINVMHLTQTDMQAFNQTLGVASPGTPTSGGMQGQGSSLSPSERATRQAQNGGGGGNTVSMDYLLNLLQKKAGK